MQELIIMNDLDRATPNLTISNFDELMTELKDRLSFYNSLIVTEDAIKEAKSDRATLNKLKTALDDERKKIKKQCLDIQTGIEGQIKQLIAPIEESMAAIDKQLAVFDEQKKAEKRQQIETIYAETIPDDYKSIVPLDRIFDRRWLNVSTTEKAIRDALADIGNRVGCAILAIQRIEPEYQAAVKAEYVRTLDLGAALRCREQAMAAAVAFSQAAPTENTPAEEKPAEAVQTPPAPPVQTAPDEKVYKATVNIRVTLSQWEALKKYMTDNGIEYTRV